MYRGHELTATIYRIGNQFDRFMAKELSGLGVSYTQAVILCRLAEMPSQTATQKELRNYLQITSASMSNTLKRMLRTGLLSQNTDTTDNRVNVISLTPKAAALVPDISACLDNAEEKICAGFSQSEKECFSTMIRRTRDNLNDCVETDDVIPNKEFNT